MKLPVCKTLTHIPNSTYIQGVPKTNPNSSIFISRATRNFEAKIFTGVSITLILKYRAVFHSCLKSVDFCSHFYHPRLQFYK